MKVRTIKKGIPVVNGIMAAAAIALTIYGHVKDKRVLRNTGFVITGAMALDTARLAHMAIADTDDEFDDVEVKASDVWTALVSD